MKTVYHRKKKIKKNKVDFLLNQILQYSVTASQCMSWEDFMKAIIANTQ